MNVHRFNNVCQTEIHATESLMPDLGFEVEIATEKLQRHKSSVIIHIRAGLIQAGGEDSLKSTILLIHLE